MYVSDCIAFSENAEIKIGNTRVGDTAEVLPALEINNHGNNTVFTISVEQLETLLNSGEWWLWKNRPTE